MIGPYQKVKMKKSGFDFVIRLILIVLIFSSLVRSFMGRPKVVPSFGCMIYIYLPLAASSPCLFTFHTGDFRGPVSKSTNARYRGYIVPPPNILGCFERPIVGRVKVGKKIGANVNGTI